MREAEVICELLLEIGIVCVCEGVGCFWEVRRCSEVRKQIFFFQ